MNLRSRILAAGVMLVVAVGAAVVAQNTFVPTTATWSDSVYATAEVSAAAQTTPPSVGPLSPGNDDTVIAGVDWNVQNSNTVGFCSTVSVTTESTTPVVWSVIVDLTQPPYASASSVQAEYPGKLTIAADGKTAILSGADDYTSTVVAGSTVNPRLCIYNPGAPAPADPSWYTVETTPLTDEWTDRQVCVRVTITGNKNLEDFPFFFGWQTELDLSEAWDALVASSGPPNNLDWSPSHGSGYNFAVTPHPSDAEGIARQYTLTSGTVAAIRGGGSFTITACLQHN